MKKFILTSLAVIFTAVVLFSFSSCESKSGKRVKEKEKELKNDSLVFSPEKIGATALLMEFIPYPKYDGGTGIRVSFSFGIQYKGKTYEVNAKGNKFFRENVTEENAKNDPSVSDLVLSHYLVSNTPKDYIDVVVVKGEVVKLTRRSSFIADEFYPKKIIWEKK